MLCNEMKIINYSNSIKYNLSHKIQKKMRKLFVQIICFCWAINFSLAQTNHNYEFTIDKQLPVTTVKDQASSGTCWSFATISFIESELIRQGQVEMDLSEMYIARNAYKHKAIMHLRMRGENFFTYGGQSHDVMNMVSLYGLMPESAFSGKINGATSHNHAKLDTAAVKFMRKIINKTGNDLPLNWISSFDTLLSTHLGRVPQNFQFQGITYTPATFSNDFLKFNPNDYVEITSYLHHQFYAPFILEDRFNWAMEEYYNVPFAEFTAIIDSALNNGYTVCWNGDVSETTFNFWSSSANAGELEGKATPELRQQLFDNHATTVDHLMHIVGTAHDRSGLKYYYTKNSWGTQNSYGGFMFLSETYIALKTVSILIHKNAIPQYIREKLGI